LVLGTDFQDIKIVWSKDTPPAPSLGGKWGKLTDYMKAVLKSVNVKSHLERGFRDVSLKSLLYQTF
jgi:hypothetical protein